MLSTGNRDVDVPLRTNTNRVNPKIKRQGYIDADSEVLVPEFEGDQQASSSSSLNGETPETKRLVRRRLVPWAKQMEIIIQCSVVASLMATLTDFIAHWRGIHPSASQGPASIKAPNHSIKPFHVSSTTEFLQHARLQVKAAPYYFFRTVVSNGAELGCFVLFRDALGRMIRGRPRIIPPPEASSPSLATTTSSSSASASSSSHVTIPREVRTVCLTPSFFVSRHLRSAETWCGVIAGALSGGLCSAVAHPYRVLETTARLEPRFNHAGNVLLTGLRENRRMLFKGLFKGWRMAVLGGAVQCGIQFGGYHILREDGAYRHPVIFFFYCWLSSLVGAIVRYPCLTLRQHWNHAYATAPLVPLQRVAERNVITRAVDTATSSAAHHPQYARRSITYRSIVQVLRRNGGISKLWDGFFASRPMLRAVPTAVLLFTYDSMVRSEAEATLMLHSSTPSRPSDRASPSQSLTSLQEATRPLPPYEFPTPADRRKAR